MAEGLELIENRIDESEDLTWNDDEKPPYSVYETRSKDKKQIKSYDIYIYTTFDEPEKYTGLMNLLNHVDKGVKVCFHVVSSGGEYATLIALLNTINRSQGEFSVSVEGEASSAAAIFVCAFNRIAVDDYASVFFHSLQMEYPSSGDVSKILKDLSNARSVYYAAVRRYCAGVLTEDEMDSICVGETDKFFTGEEFKKRLRDAGKRLF